MTEKPVLIEQTRKKYKAMILIGWLGILLGFPIAISTDHPIAWIVVIYAMCMVVCGSILAWWHHA